LEVVQDPQEVAEPEESAAVDYPLPVDPLR
jgi:hypothetical protein